MDILEQRISRDGKVLPGGILKVDSFLNHQIDVRLYSEMAKEWHRLYAGENVNKILTIEASGIGIACIAGQVFSCPVLFAKKSRSRNLEGSLYTARVRSFTHGGVSTIYVCRDYLSSGDRVLIIDDFLANGAALSGLISLVEQAGAVLVGAGIAIEKAFQPGGEMIRSRGIRVESLARIKKMSPEDGIEFC